MSVTAVAVEDAPAVEVGPGCTLRDLPGGPDVRAWQVVMQAGSRWPRVDHHPHGEQVYVVSGELIEGDDRYPAGTFLWYPPGSSHQPRTETGVTLIGSNPSG